MDQGVIHYGWGKPFSLKLGESPHECLTRWYYQTSPEQERVGDVALHPFEENVIPFELVVGFQGDMEISLSRYNPYRSSFFLFYSYSDYTNDIYVWGGLTWVHLYKLGGSFMFDVSILSKNRAFPLVYEPPMFKQPKTKNDPWFIPVDLPRSASTNLDSVNGTLDDIIGRFEWVVGRRTEPPREDTVSALALGIFECTLDERRAEFHAERMRKEKERLFAKFEPLDEIDLLRLLADNGLKDYMNEAMVEDPTHLDLYWFWVRNHALNLAPCTAVFRIPLEECPTIFTGMPLYSRGLIHLTYTELPQWLWHLFVTQSQKLAEKRLDFSAEERWIKMLHDIWEKAPAPSQVVHPRMQDNRKSDIPALNADIEDLLRVAPPCVGNCMKAARFPENKKGLALVPILQEAGISQSIVFNWFETKNASFPHETVVYKDAKSRFPYEWIWNARRGPTYCKNIIKNTSTTHMLCPYANQPNYQQLCSPDERFPFSGPHTLIKRRLKYKK